MATKDEDQKQADTGATDTLDDGPVHLRLADGKEYQLLYDLNALAYIGDRLKLNIRLAHVREDLLEAPLPFSAIRTIIYAGLRRDHDDLTEERVGELITQENVQQVLEGFTELFGVNLQELSRQQLPGAGDADVSSQAAERASP